VMKREKMGEKSSLPPDEGEVGQLTRQVENELSRSDHRARKNYVDIIQLIRSIQRAEGKTDCFSKLDCCEDMLCSWRPYCLEKPLTPS
jgi:hypothetical protein